MVWIRLCNFSNHYQKVHFLEDTLVDDLITLDRRNSQLSTNRISIQHIPTSCASFLVFHIQESNGRISTYKIDIPSGCADGIRITRDGHCFHIEVELTSDTTKAASDGITVQKLQLLSN